MKNFKVRCIDDVGGCFTKNKIYKVKNGRMRFDDGEITDQIYRSVGGINKTFSSQFELVEEPLKVGDYVVTKKKIRPVENFDFLSVMIVETPTRINSISFSGNIKLANEYHYIPHWLKKVNPPKKENLDGKNR